MSIRRPRARFTPSLHTAVRLLAKGAQLAPTGRVRAGPGRVRGAPVGAPSAAGRPSAWRPPPPTRARRSPGAGAADAPPASPTRPAAPGSLRRRAQRRRGWARWWARWWEEGRERLGRRAWRWCLEPLPPLPAWKLSARGDAQQQNEMRSVAGGSPGDQLEKGKKT
jgi:hypothetical protein